MALTKLFDKQGVFCGYRVKLFKGRTSDGKQEYYPTMIIHRKEGETEKACHNRAVKEEAIYEKDCRDGKVLSKQERKEKEAEEALKEKQAWRFGAYFNHVMDMKAHEDSIITINTYFKLRERIVDYIGEDTKVTDITTSVCNGFISSLYKAESKTGKSGNKTISICSIRRYYTLLKLVLNEAMKEDVITYNPMSRIPTPKASKDSKENKNDYVPSKEELKKIIDILEDKDLKTRAMIRFLIDSGCRAGELCGLKWSDFDFERGSVTICRAVGYSDKHTFITRTKTGSTRTLYISRCVMDIMQEWKNRQAMQYFGRGISTDGYCFTQDCGALLIPNDITNKIVKFGKAIGLPQLHPHCFRHSMITHSIEAGVPVTDVAARAGHTDSTTTLKVYAHATQAGAVKARDTFSKALYEDAQ
ncbi:MAG: site-specific integrase [Saccharofermentans sp.]|nr:site-specific integrase [Saccharofermentans sp.]